MTETTTPQVAFGHEMRRAHFGFAPGYTPINHGSYGATPVPVRAAHQALRDEVESAPDPFIALSLAPRLARQRELAASLLRCGSANELVLVPNATTGVDTVLRNIDWQAGDVILCYEVVYGAVGLQLRRVAAEHPGVEVRTVGLDLPASDEAVVGAVVGAAREVRAQPGKRLRLAVVDLVVSMPGYRMPFERLVPLLQAEGALVLVDGAHGAGHVDLDLAALAPDFLVTNLHKWLFVPRGCAALYVAARNRRRIRSALPTGWGSLPAEEERAADPGKAFVQMFNFIACTDMTNFLCVEAALDFRQSVCGGEAAIRAYSAGVARRGGDAAAAALGTEVMDCAGSSLRACNFANVRLPLPSPALLESPASVSEWVRARGVEESGVYIMTLLYRGAWWWRVSGMVYVEEADFVRAAEVLRALCERVRRGEHVGR